MYQRLTPRCVCGKQPMRLREIGLTAGNHLVVYWRCSDCRKHMYVLKALSDLEDDIFLGTIGVRRPEEKT